MKENTLKKIFCIQFLLVIFTILILAFTSGANIRNVTAKRIVLWHFWVGDDEKQLKKVLRDFEDAHPEIKIDAVSVNYASMKDRFLHAKVKPDLIWGAAEWLEPLKASASLLPLNELIGSKETFLPASIQCFSLNGKLFGIPTAFQTLAFIYNKDAVPKPPTTVDEMIAVFKSHRKPREYRIGYPYDKLYFHAPWIHAFGGYVVDTAGYPGLDSKGTVDSVKFVNELLNRNDLLDFNPDYSTIIKDFKAKKIYFMINGPWVLKDLEHSGVKYGIALIPKVNANYPPSSPFATAIGLMVSKSTLNKNICVELAKFLALSDSIARIAIDNQYFPANSIIYSRKGFSSNTVLKKFWQQGQSSIAYPNQAGMDLVWKVSPKYLSVALRPRTSARWTMNALQNEVVAALNNAKKQTIPKR